MDSIINKSCCFTGHRKIDSDEYTMIVEKLELKIMELYILDVEGHWDLIR